MAFEKIENADLIGKMIAELADVPELTADELKKRFDAASKDVIIPKFNKLIDALAALSAASNIGMNPPEGITAEQNIAAVITALAVSVKSNSDSSHSHSNKVVIDAITADAKKKYDDLVSLFSAIKTISNVVKDDSTLLPTGKAIVDYVKELGGGDMLKATYDSDDDGVVDDASKLGGQLPAYYQKSTDNTLQTDNKTVAGAINEVYGMAQNGGKNLIGEDFSPKKSYTVGKHVINGNSRYRFIVDHPAGPWDASHVEEILVDKEVEDLNEKFEDAAKKIVVLWTNPEWNSSTDLTPFVAQEIQIDNISDFDMIGICHSSYKNTYNYFNFFLNIFNKENNLTETFSAVNATDYYVRLYYRKFIITQSGIKFDIGYSNSHTQVSANNKYAIPVKIIGIKF